jgi:hypothetical protein
VGSRDYPSPLLFSEDVKRRRRKVYLIAVTQIRQQALFGFGEPNGIALTVCFFGSRANTSLC